MDSSDGFFSEEELDALVTRFRNTVEQDANEYFEADELEAIADALLKRDDIVLATKSVEKRYIPSGIPANKSENPVLRIASIPNK